MNYFQTDATRAELAKRVSADYDAASVELFREGFRNHLGASEIGKPCERELWYKFRWFHNANPGGRMYRLFQRGHREEPFVFDHYRLMGYTVNTVDPETGKQFRLAALLGHYGGSCDGRGYFPEWAGYTREIGFEVKTYKDKHWRELAKVGLAKKSPKYAAQMDTYGAAWGIEYFVFTAVNKDTDETHFEIYKCNWDNANHLLIKAQRIIFAAFPPPKINSSPSFSECRYCDFKQHCHFGAMPEVNCRSCKLCEPVDNAQFKCHLVGQIIPPEVIVKGCSSWAVIG